MRSLSRLGDPPAKARGHIGLTAVLLVWAAREAAALASGEPDRWWDDPSAHLRGTFLGLALDLQLLAIDVLEVTPSPPVHLGAADLTIPLGAASISVLLEECYYALLLEASTADIAQCCPEVDLRDVIASVVAIHRYVSALGF